MKPISIVTVGLLLMVPGAVATTQRLSSSPDGNEIVIVRRRQLEPLFRFFNRDSGRWSRQSRHPTTQALPLGVTCKVLTNSSEVETHPKLSSINNSEAS
jgi:hypothetical protein